MESARQVLAEALELLEAHETGAEEEDLREDFTTYWNQREFGGGPALALLYQEGATTGACVSTVDEVFAFGNKRSMMRWWENRTGHGPRFCNAAHFINLRSFPHPSSFPTDGPSLITFLDKFTHDGSSRVFAALSSFPRASLFILVGQTPLGRTQFAGLRLVKREPLRKDGFRHKKRVKLNLEGKIARHQLMASYGLQRLRTSRLDSASTRATIDIGKLIHKKVILVGCGALGSGIARMLAKAGIGKLTLVDGELLGWENIRRHELGGTRIRLPKAEAIAETIKADLPELQFAVAYNNTIQDVVLSGAKLLEGADMIIACTGSLHADTFIDEISRAGGTRIPVVFGWMEAWGVAAHGVLLTRDSSSILDGFEDGSPRFPAARNENLPPKECGNTATPFGATELAAAQAMITELCLEVLLDPAIADTWRTWWTSDRNLERVGGNWTDEFQALKPVSCQSGVLERRWP
ncbi:molybdopterin/thiamine biosynthesis adenylyltransferase [Phyllobacterium myrsinacearum]|uniref:Molybdopterin/thiamine biosynthesis adenylyltransferase n=2 Tax=Phyllobacterium myrsinacearum TaxID=28101 RepID=A0A839EKA9_9HYPH|nr:molybdopterin/thiamine biosynthesis adenylyltransferase [Phyllobacterium myrsinacearum]